MSSAYDCLVIGCGFAGAVIGRELAERAGKKVLIIEKRSHIGGNAYDFTNNDGILLHKYGPHIFHTNFKRVFDYLSRFTQWRDYSHEVLANVYGRLIPVPFNLNSLYMTFEPHKAKKVEEKLIFTFGLNKKVTIGELKAQTDDDLVELADYVYKNIFLYYTQKQWGTSPEHVDPSVTARVPILISHDNRYFQDTYQGMPANGYTSLFENILNHPDITLLLNYDAVSHIKMKDDKVFLDDEEFTGTIIYTGAIDELFSCCFGPLPYRTLDFEFETHDVEWYQEKGTINYTVDMPYTRITEFKHLTGQVLSNRTVIMKEYPGEYTGKNGQIPYYAILNNKNVELYQKYKQRTDSLNDFHLLGRLAEYKYYNMDAIVERALALADQLCCKEGKE
ncbi:UDP-galactopyranose mutase [Oxobacter pfennigii]|uniref:UDP-galactopyranose mutase n=1 Tax=Oxobacter pfennigii TaxID=36849 RepID=A0A0N8NTG2_9CLOT|nr:UDP-galactopyranose mutase [Oxobacter pfennigii]KPU44744.1 UDP-galactopyranose mutase [Oxobacter pfennigii]